VGDIIVGKVIKVINNCEIVINKGYVDGVNNQNRFLIYKLGPELKDPDTNESLGFLEYVCGEGRPKHIQEKMTTLVTAKKKTKKAKTVIKRNVFNPLVGDTEETYEPEEYEVPFENVSTDCLVKQINN